MQHEGDKITVILYEARAGERSIRKKNTFERDRSNPKLGEAWKDPKGVIWGDVVTNEDESPKLMTLGGAINYCHSIGAELPDEGHYLYLATSLGGGWHMYDKLNPKKALHEDCNADYLPFVLPNLIYENEKPEDRRFRFFWAQNGDAKQIEAEEKSRLSDGDKKTADSQNAAQAHKRRAVGVMFNGYRGTFVRNRFNDVTEASYAQGELEYKLPTDNGSNPFWSRQNTRAEVRCIMTP